MGRFTCLCVLLLLAATPQAQRPQSTPGGQRVIVASTHGGRTATGRKGKHHPGVSGAQLAADTETWFELLHRRIRWDHVLSRLPLAQVQIYPWRYLLDTR